MASVIVLKIWPGALICYREMTSWVRAEMCAGQERGTCVSQGSRFPRFQLEGHPPRKVYKGSEDLTLCRFYRKQTCCSSLQTNAALALLARLATGGEASPECLALWEVLECSICDPHIGVSPGPPLLCASLCDSLFAACSDAYFSADPIHQVLQIFLALKPCINSGTVSLSPLWWTVPMDSLLDTVSKDFMNLGALCD